MKLSIIIPVYNEEKTVIQLLKKVLKVSFSGVEKEIVVVDDGSTDASASAISNFKFQISNFKFIKHKKNLGKGEAVRTAIKHATGDYIVIQDADLEYDPQQIGKLLRPIQKGTAVVVYGTRLKRLPNFSRDEKKPLFVLTYLGNKFLSLITSILYLQWITDMETCYKLIPKKAVRDMVLKSKGFEFEPEITVKLMKKGYKIIEVPISTIPRDHGEGKKLRPIKDGIHALWVLLKYRFID